MQEELIKTAIIGIGAWGKNIARELALVSDLAAYASQGSKASAAWAREHIPKARASTIREICDDPAIVAVLIATPTSSHAAIAQQCIAAGKQVFIEKPTAPTALKAQFITTEAEKSNLLLATGYIFLYSPVYRELKRRIGNAAVTKVSAVWNKYGTFAEPIELNLLTHHLAIALDLLGEARTIALERPTADGNEITATLTYDHAEFLSRINRNSQEKVHTFEVTIEGGMSYLWNGPELLQRDTAADDYRQVYQSNEQPLTVELTNFIKKIQGIDAYLPTAGSFGVRVLALLERAGS